MGRDQEFKDTVETLTRKLTSGQQVDWEEVAERFGDEMSRAILAELRKDPTISRTLQHVSIDETSVDGLAPELEEQPTARFDSSIGDGVSMGLGELDSLDQPQKGEQFLAHYRLEEEIGRGGMGTVYRAQDTLLDRRVAVKVLADELSANSEHRARFVREARIIARMAHPNLPQIYFVGNAKAKLFFAMEWIDGESLDEVLRRGQVSVTVALEWIRQVATGLEEANRAGVVHRDIKPSNLMVTPDGVVKVLDFGIARSTGFEAGTMGTGGFVGTPHYASPEQARGEKADHRSDIYSTGLVLFALLTGQAPFDGTNALAILTDRIVKPVPELPVDSSFSTEVRQLVRRMLAKDPGDRPQSWAALHTEIEAAVPGHLVPAGSGKRIWAGMLDVLLIALPLVVIWAVFQMVTGYFPTTPIYDSILGRACLGLVLLGWPCAYSLLLPDGRGRTPGQRAEGIEVVTLDGAIPTRPRRAARVLAIWSPVAMGMVLQPDWPPAAESVYGNRISTLLLEDLPHNLLQIWVLILLVMPAVSRGKRHLADLVAGVRVCELQRPWRTPSVEEPVRSRPGSRQPSRHLVRLTVFGAWLIWAGFQVHAGFTESFGRLPIAREVVVAGQPGWDRLLDRFMAVFLGPDETVANPKSLQFERGPFSGLLCAAPAASDSVRIVNSAFGSELIVKGGVMTSSAGGRRRYHNCRTWRRELAPSSTEEAASWDRAREEAYRGSLAHFLRSLIHSRLNEEGFTVENPEDFEGLFRRGDGFLLVASPRLEVRVKGDPETKSIHLGRGFLAVSETAADISGRWGSSGWRSAPLPRSTFIRFAAKQDSLWGRPTKAIQSVVSLD